MKLCLANLSTKSLFGSFAKLRKHFFEEKRSLHHLETPKGAAFEDHPRVPKKLTVRGYPLLTTVRRCGASRRLRVCLCSCPARLDPSRPSDSHWRLGTASSPEARMPMYMARGMLACLGFRV